MIRENIYANMSGWYRLLFLILFFIGGMFLAILLTVVTVSLLGKDGGTWSSVTFMKISQFIQTISMFFLPAICYGYMFRENLLNLSEEKMKPSIFGLLLILVLVALAQPIILLMSYYNQQMALPESLSVIEMWMKHKEESVAKILGLFLEDKSLASYISNILIIAVVAGVVEEYFFRGCLQRILYRICNNYHLAVWITAFIFSAIHFQFYGFIPRLIAGAMLGYLFVWTKSLWYPIFAHIIHNALHLLVSQFHYGTPEYEEMEYMGVEEHKWLVLISCIVLGALVFFVKKKEVLLATNERQ